MGRTESKRHQHQALHQSHSEFNLFNNSELETYIQKRAPQFLKGLEQFSKRWFDGLGIEDDTGGKFSGKHFCEIATLALAHGITLATAGHGVDIFRIDFRVKKNPKTEEKLRYEREHSVIEIMDPFNKGLIVDPTYSQFHEDFFGQIHTFPFAAIEQLEPNYPGATDRFEETIFPTEDSDFENIVLTTLCRPLTQRQLRFFIQDYRNLVSIMSSTKTKEGNYPINKWNEYPDISQLIDPSWKSRPDRHLLKEVTEEVLIGTSAWLTHDRFDSSTLHEWREKNLKVLDVCCGHHVLQRKVITTPVGRIPNAYGIDPLLNFYPGLPGRTLPAYAEDMPFKDDAFDITFSQRGVGWYAGTAINPIYAVEEMIRVTKPGGLVSIFIGEGGGSTTEKATFVQNHERILLAIEQIRLTELGKKIKIVNDFTDKVPAQITIRL